MKLLSRVLMVVLALAFLASTASAQKARKLLESAYIKSAKIAIVSGDTARYKEAIVMLDSLIMNYGMHPEAYFWLNQIQVDFIEKTPGLAAKEQYVKKLAAYRDSVHMACTSDSVKEKYKKGCPEFLQNVDSTTAKYWRVFYNNGVQQFQAVQEAAKEIGPSADSASNDFNTKKLNANADSALANMNMCIILDSTDDKAYLLAGTVLEQKKDYAGSTDWLNRGLRFAKDSTGILLQIAYGFVQENKYCDAIPYFRNYVKRQPNDTSTLVNLTICYNNCKMYDSAAAINRQILQLDPNRAEALSGLGRYYNQLGLFANDSASFYRNKNDDAGTKKWSDVRTQMFDSAKTYFRRGFDADPSNTMAAEEYGVISFLTNDFAAAAEVFGKLTQIEPNRASHWTSLGDANLNLKKFPEAAAAYEKVVQLEPDNRQIWERLADLYAELKEPAKAAEAKKHLQ